MQDAGDDDWDDNSVLTTSELLNRYNLQQIGLTNRSSFGTRQRLSDLHSLCSGSGSSTRSGAVAPQSQTSHALSLSGLSTTGLTATTNDANSLFLSLASSDQQTSSVTAIQPGSSSVAKLQQTTTQAQGLEDPKAQLLEHYMAALKGFAPIESQDQSSISKVEGEDLSQDARQYDDTFGTKSSSEESYDGPKKEDERDNDEEKLITLEHERVRDVQKDADINCVLLSSQNPAGADIIGNPTAARTPGDPPQQDMNTQQSNLLGQLKTPGQLQSSSNSSSPGPRANCSLQQLQPRQHPTQTLAANALIAGPPAHTPAVSQPVQPLPHHQNVQLTGQIAIRQAAALQQLQLHQGNSVALYLAQLQAINPNVLNLTNQLAEAINLAQIQLPVNPSLLGLQTSATMQPNVLLSDQAVNPLANLTLATQLSVLGGAPVVAAATRLTQPAAAASVEASPRKMPTDTNATSVDCHNRSLGNNEKTQTREDRWTERYNQLVEFKQKHGHCRVPHGYPANKKLSWWVMNQRAERKKGEKGWLSQDRIRMLDNVGFIWQPHGKRSKINIPSRANINENVGKT